MKRVLSMVVGAVCALACVSAASALASAPVQLVLSQGAAFSLLGHSCGGIQEESFSKGFAASGYPEGDVYMQTRCGGSGRGGGYKTTTYSAWADVVWTWYGETRSFSRLEASAAAPGSEATDSHGDRIYDSGTRAYLETGEPPYQPPGAPFGVSGSVYSYETGAETEAMQMTVSWSLDPETAGLVSSSTVTATPVPAGPPVLTAAATGGSTTASLGPVQPDTSYEVTVTSTDAEGTSEASAPVEVMSPVSNAEKEHKRQESLEAICESDTGTIKLSPGLSETPHVQNITVKGRLAECDGKAGADSASYVAHLKTIGEVTCSTLWSLSAEPTTEPVSLSVKWAPKELGVSHGSLVLAITEAGGAALSGTLEGGPFGSAQAITGGEAFEAFNGGPECGVPQGTKKAKPVKSGTFSGTALEIG